MDLMGETLLSAARRLRSRELGCVELARAVLETIRESEPLVGAYLSLREDVLAQAEDAQRLLDTGEALSPLAGIPLALKDNICTMDIATTCASRMLADFTPPYDATVVERLRESGAVVLGKCNMDEFAMGGSTETSFFGPTRNPWDTRRVPGGSSGGPAAAVAAGSALCALGSDTGGSLRQPCAFCGVSGIKPTYGAVSRYGLVAFASSLDQIGPIGRDVADCAAVLEVISGHDPRDATSAAGKPLHFSTSFSGSVEGLRVGIPRAYFGGELNGEVAAAVMAAAKTFARMGAAVREFDLDLTAYAAPAYYIVACAEASSNLSRYDGIRYGYRPAGTDHLNELCRRARGEGFGAEVKRRILLGTFVLHAGHYESFYQKASLTRRLIGQAFDDALRSFDIILSPVAPTTAYRLGERIDDPLQMYRGDVYTVAVNLAGLPAVALPCGFDASGLPIGMQLIGRAFAEPLLVRAGHAFQLQTDFHLRRPSLRGGAVA